MLRNSFFTIGWLCIFSLSFGQTTKLSLNLQQRIQKAERNAQKTRIFVKGDLAEIKKFVRQNGGDYLYGAGDIAAVRLSLNQLRSLAKRSAVKRIEDGRQPLHLLNDRMVLNNFIQLVHLGMPPLSQSYTGKGVLMGIIDTGIDFKHLDFKDDSNKTRVQYIWDQRAFGSFQPYGYGREWTATDIDAGVSTHVDPLSGNGHGTNVSGIAAGDGSTVNNFTGVAPDADIAVVASRFNDVITSNGDTVTWLGTIADGVHYLFSKADSMNQPCVINISLGSYQGSHDGKDLPAQLISNMIREKNGRVVVAAAGNAGQVPYHLGYQVSQDTSFTWFKYVGAYGQIFFDLWADSADFSEVRFAFGIDKVSPAYQFRGATAFDSIQNDLGQYHYDTLRNSNGDRMGIIETGRELVGNRYHMEVTIRPDSTSGYHWRFMTTGNGRFDLWSLPDPSYNGNPNRWQMVHNPVNLPDSTTFPPITNYKLPDTLKNMVSSFQCAPEVITVANYMNREQYYNVEGDLVKLKQPKGTMALNSSSGPTRDGRLKPELSASGNGTLSAAIIELANWYAFNRPNEVGLGGRHMLNGGTSMASPVVAGAVGLLFEKYPNIDYKIAKEILTKTAYTDQFTGPTPNYKAGHGKLHAHDMMSTELIWGCTDPTAYNYDPEANISDSSCLPVTYGCTDTAAMNYDSTANTDDGSCQYASTDIKTTSHEGVGLANYPNPFSGVTTIHYKLPASVTQGQIQILNNLGETIQTYPVDPSTGYFMIDGKSFSPGLYVYQLKSGSTVLQSNRMVVIQ